MYIPFISRRSETRCQATPTASTGPNIGTYSFRSVHMTLIAQLVRLHALPCYICFYLYGSLEASPFVPPKALLYTLIVIADFMYQLRGSAMILNNILDGEINVSVPQTPNRPIGRGAITPLLGYLWIVYHVLCFIATIMWGRVAGRVPMAESPAYATGSSLPPCTTLHGFHAMCDWAGLGVWPFCWRGGRRPGSFLWSAFVTIVDRKRS